MRSLIIATLLLNACRAEKPTCPFGNSAIWHYDPKTTTCYGLAKFSSTARNWKKGSDLCSTFGGSSIASVRDSYQEAILKQLVAEANAGACWIGLKKRYGENWYWHENGRALKGYSNWASYDDSYSSLNSIELCAILSVSGWIQRPCSENFPQCVLCTATQVYGKELTETKQIEAAPFFPAGLPDDYYDWVPVGPPSSATFNDVLYNTLDGDDSYEVPYNGEYSFPRDNKSHLEAAPLYYDTAIPRVQDELPIVETLLLFGDRNTSPPLKKPSETTESIGSQTRPRTIPPSEGFLVKQNSNILVPDGPSTVVRPNVIPREQAATPVERVPGNAFSAGIHQSSIPGNAFQVFGIPGAPKEISADSNNETRGISKPAGIIQENKPVNAAAIPSSKPLNDVPAVKPQLKPLINREPSLPFVDRIPVNSNNENSIVLDPYPDSNPDVQYIELGVVETPLNLLDPPQIVDVSQLGTYLQNIAPDERIAVPGSLEHLEESIFLVKPQSAVDLPTESAPLATTTEASELYYDKSGSALNYADIVWICVSLIVLAALITSVVIFKGFSRRTKETSQDTSAQSANCSKVQVSEFTPQWGSASIENTDCEITVEPLRSVAPAPFYDSTKKRRRVITSYESYKRKIDVEPSVPTAGPLRLCRSKNGKKPDNEATITFSPGFPSDSPTQCSTNDPPTQCSDITTQLPTRLPPKLNSHEIYNYTPPPFILKYSADKTPPPAIVRTRTE